MNYNANKDGYYGEFGGAFIPEMLYPNVEELRQQYLEIMQEASFRDEFKHLLKEYVGRPTPLYCKASFRKIQHQNILKTRRSLSYRSS